MNREQLRRLDLAGWPLPDEYLIELGRLSALWTYLEASLMVTLTKLSGFNEPENPVPFILLAHASFPQRLDMLGTLCEQLGPRHPHLEDSGVCLTKLRAAQKSRNRFLHNGITINSETRQAEIGSGAARGKLKISVEPINPTEIRAASAEVHEAQRALVQLVLRNEIPSKFNE